MESERQFSSQKTPILRLSPDYHRKLSLNDPSITDSNETISLTTKLFSDTQSQGASDESHSFPNENIGDIPTEYYVSENPTPHATSLNQSFSSIFIAKEASISTSPSFSNLEFALQEKEEDTSVLSFSGSNNPVKASSSFIPTIFTASPDLRFCNSIRQKQLGTETIVLGPFGVNIDVYQAIKSELDATLFSLLNFCVPGHLDYDEYGDLSGIYDIEAVDSLPLVLRFEGDGSIGAGDLKSLVLNLWADFSSSDGDDGGVRRVKYGTDFLLTFRYFTDGFDVARLLMRNYLDIGRWSIADETVKTIPATYLNYLDTFSIEKQSDSEYCSKSEWSNFLQLRILNFFKKWIESHPADFARDDHLFNLTATFLNKHVKQENTGNKSKFAVVISSSLQERVKEYLGSKNTIIPQLPSLAPAKFGTFFLPSPNLRSPQISPRTLTLFSGSLLSKFRNNSVEFLQQTSATISAIGISGSENLTAALGRRFSSISSTPSNVQVYRNSTVSSTPTSRPGTPLISNALGNLKSRIHSRTTSARKIQPIPITKIYENTVLVESEDSFTQQQQQQQQQKKNSLFIDFDPEIFAQQLTFLEYEYFRRIPIAEFYAQSWTKKKNDSSPLVSFVDWFNRVAYGVATEVVKQKSIRDRVETVKRFILVGNKCVKLRNYNATFEVVAGLNLAAVSRL
ncbi:hypothetical protein HK100_003370, partial [Physocladia obscura]